MANSAVFYGAVAGICVGLGICVVALVIFVIVFCRVKIKDDSNTRKRLITNNAFDEEKTVAETRPRFIPPAILEEPEPPSPIMLPPLPPPEPIIMPRPVLPMPRPLPPPQPMEPRVIIREVVRQPEPQPQIIREVIREREPVLPPVERTVVRRRSWGGPQDDDWVLVKKIKKRRSGKRSDSESSSSSGSSSSSNSSSDDEDDHHHHHHHRPARPMRYVYPRLEAYDLATPVVYGQQRPMAGFMQQPTMIGPSAVVGGGPSVVMAPMASGAPTTQNYVPFIIQQPTM
jgi:hypothetical protein